MTKHGFSFIEVLLAMAIISFLISGTAEMLIRANVLKRHGDLNVWMTGLALSKLEILKSSSYESPDLEADFHSERIEDFRRAIFQREWTVWDVSPEAKRILIKVYPDDHPEKSIQIGLLLSRDLGF